MNEKQFVALQLRAQASSASLTYDGANYILTDGHDTWKLFDLRTVEATIANIETGWEEADSEDEEEETQDPIPFSEWYAGARIEAAEAALVHMDEEWLQNEFGQEQTDVIYDALNLYIETTKKEIEA